MEEKPSAKESPLCRTFSDGDHRVDIDIYEDGEGGWMLEIIDQYNNTTVWEDVFETDEEALQEALDALKEEGIGAFIGPAETAEGWEPS